MGTEIELTKKRVKMCSAGNRTQVSWLPLRCLTLLWIADQLERSDATLTAENVWFSLEPATERASQYFQNRE